MCALSIMSACTQEEPAPIRVESIELDSEELELIEGSSVSLVATILPEDAENQNVIWSSSNKAVASVKDGEVTAVSVGEATITAKSEDGGKKATCVVTVNAKHIPVSAVTLDKEEVTLIIEDKVTLTATVAPENASNKTIVWTSSDESIATVKDGEVTALKIGEAIITATSEDGGKKATCKVTVIAKPVPVTGVSLNKQKARIFINDELTLTATITPEDATNKTITWTTSNASVATVKNGAVKGISIGEADITVKTEDGNHTATCKVSVTEESQTQTKGPMTLDLGTVTSTTATFNGVLDVDMLGDYDMNGGGVGFIYAPVDQPLNIVTSTKVQISEVDAQGKFTHTLTGLKYNSEYHYAIFVYKNTICQYGETQTFETAPIDIELKVTDITQTRATFAGRLTLPENDKELEVGILYSTESDPTIATEGVEKIWVTDVMDADGGFSHRAEGLLFDNSHYYRYYVKQGDTYTYGSVQNFKTEMVSVTLAVGDITQTTAIINSKVELTEDDLIEVGVLYSQSATLTAYAKGVVKQKLTPDSSGTLSFKAEGLMFASTYNYCYYICQNEKYTYGTALTFVTLDIEGALSLTDDGTANCYIVPQSGCYKIKAVKGNSNESVGDMRSTEVLWETFGTNISPKKGDLVSYAVCSQLGYIVFEVSSPYKEGNAVIAAKDANGTILWSWHIWMTDQPQGQVYNNNAGTMMDRNLGATSATPGDVGALGLLYQWGRKDPFLGSSSISSSTVAKSTITWPSAVQTGSYYGTVDYVTSHPTTFVDAVLSPRDWHYSARDNTLWTTSGSTKSIYDPCPAGWRVPDGGRVGVWSKACGSSSDFYDCPYDNTNAGMNFSGKFGSASSIWYPASGYRDYEGSLDFVGGGGYCWSAFPYSTNMSEAYGLYFRYYGYVFPSDDYYRANGYSVRCLQESK